MSETFISGKDLLAELEIKEAPRVIKILLDALEDLHLDCHKQSLKDNLENEEVFCSCADAYRIGHAFLKEKNAL